MRSDDHESFQRRIDETLAGEIAGGEEESLREHLASCPQCQEYLAAGTRVIAGLGGFSFDVDPALQEKVCAAINSRAQQIERGQPFTGGEWLGSALPRFYSVSPARSSTCDLAA